MGKVRPHLSFEGGGLAIHAKGYPEQNGYLIFTEENLEPLTEYDDETGARWDGFIVKLPASELVAIRDFLNEWLTQGGEGDEG